MMMETMPQLIAEKIKILARIRARNEMVHSMRLAVKRNNDNDAQKLKNLEKIIKNFDK